MTRTAVLGAMALAASAVGQTRPYGVNSVTYEAGTSPPGADTSKYALIAATGATPNDVLSTVFPEAFVESDSLLNGPGTTGAGQRNCAITQNMPTKPRSLSFCHKFNDQACCVPQQDDEDNEFFGSLTALGLSCRIRGDIREDPLAKLYCMNCDPQQPRYVRPTMSINVNTDPDSITNIEGMAIASYANGDAATRGNLNQLLISQAWAAGEFGTNPILSGPSDRFAKCGLLVSSPCQGDAGPLDNRDRYTCGDDLFIPPEAFRVVNSSTGAVNAVESFEKMLNTDDLGTPQLDQRYYFRVIEERTCTDAEAAAKTAPDCLRTAEQITNVAISGLTTTFGAATTFQDLVCGIDCEQQVCNTTILGLAVPTAEQERIMCCCFPWFDELAFNSGAMAAPSAVLSAVLACLAVVVAL
mmetsp:Transcript_17261/g.44991  ORF Transcript_17261/g.44991 Transcript_17261/m.44991 type:complete len:413 (+) Transcript_17261:180-1418(+)